MLEMLGPLSSGENLPAIDDDMACRSMTRLRGRASMVSNPEVDAGHLNLTLSAFEHA